MNPTTRRGRRRIGRAAAAGLALALIVAAALLGRQMRGGADARAAFPLAEGQVELPGLSAPVELLRDPRGVPHVLAQSDADALLGLGYAHAQDRLAQMLWLARSARGRAAELEGAGALERDRLARTLDFGGLADAQHGRLDPATRAALASYAAGVNARIERIRSGRVAPPMLLARRREALEPWSPTDSLALMKLYAWGLSGSLQASLVLEDLIEHLGPFAARRFFPDADAGSLPLRRSSPVTAGREPREPGPGPDPLRRALGMSGRSVGSSAWVLGGAHTRSGRPILVADTHLEPTAPALLHVVHVRGAELDVAGSTLPGVPVFWTGHNRRVAWASTHARAATSDLYVETLHPSQSDRYHDGQAWRPLRERVETIRVRSGADREMRVQETRHGPLVNGLLDAGREPLALAWTGARRGDRSLSSWLAVARADSADALLAALAQHAVPPLAVVYADAAGAAGLQVAGWIPRRPIATGLVTLPGRARHYDWGDPIPYAALPRVRLNGGRGWAIAADNRFPPAGENEHIEWLWRSGQRARRIDQLLRSAVGVGPVELRRMVRVQADQRMLRGPELVADALALVGDAERLGAETREVAVLLSGWNGEARASSAGAAAYHVFLGALTDQLLERRLGRGLLTRYLGLPHGDPAELVAEILREALRGGDPDDLGWSDPERVRGAVVDSLRETWFRLSYDLGPNRRKWSWGRLHPLQFRPLGLERVAAGERRLGPFAYGGSSSTIGVAEYDPALPYAVRTASTYRFAIDASALDEALVALAPGPSEHPGHRHYRSGLDPWLEAKPGLLSSSHLGVAESAVSRLVLAPAP